MTTNYFRYSENNSSMIWRWVFFLDMYAEIFMVKYYDIWNSNSNGLTWERIGKAETETWDRYKANLAKYWQVVNLVHLWVYGYSCTTHIYMFEFFIIKTFS